MTIRKSESRDQFRISTLQKTVGSSLSLRGGGFILKPRTWQIQTVGSSLSLYLLQVSYGGPSSGLECRIRYRVCAQQWPSSLLAWPNASFPSFLMVTMSTDRMHFFTSLVAYDRICSELRFLARYSNNICSYIFPWLAFQMTEMYPFFDSCCTAAEPNNSNIKYVCAGCGFPSQPGVLSIPASCGECAEQMLPKRKVGHCEPCAMVFCTTCSKPSRGRSVKRARSETAQKAPKVAKTIEVFPTAVFYFCCLRFNLQLLLWRYIARLRRSR